MQILTAPGLYRNRNVHCTALLSFLSLSRRFIRRNLYTSYQSHLHIEFLPLPDSKNSSTSPLSFPKFSFRIKNRSTYSGTTKHRSSINSLVKRLLLLPPFLVSLVRAKGKGVEKRRRCNLSRYVYTLSKCRGGRCIHARGLMEGEVANSSRKLLEISLGLSLNQPTQWPVFLGWKRNNISCRGG